MALRSKPGPSVPRPPSRDSNEEREMDFDYHRDYRDQDFSAGQVPTAHVPNLAYLLNNPRKFWPCIRRNAGKQLRGMLNCHAILCSSGDSIPMQHHRGETRNYFLKQYIISLPAVVPSTGMREALPPAYCQRLDRQHQQDALRHS